MAAALASVVAVGCTKYPSPEELSLLEQQIEAADAAEARVAELEKEKARLEAELERQKKILSEHEAEMEEIKRRLQEKK
jgi:predicted RNase H-like nuclease (RuvC/YqgF family)